MTNINLQNHFQKFDLTEDFDLDLDLLEEKYLNFQQIFHPDKLIGKSKEEQINLEHNSLLINEAYEILKNPLQRAIYLLKIISKININDDNCKIKPNQETLIENLELRELIFESENKEELENVRKNCKKNLKEILKEAKLNFQNKNYQQCAINLIKAKYLDKSIYEIKLKNNALN